MSFDLWAVDDEGFDPYQHRIFCHIARVGVCFQSVRTMSDLCSISTGKVSETKNWLLENGYIEWAIDPKTGRKGVRIIEFWCSPHERRSQGEQDTQECSPHEHPVQGTNGNVHHMNTGVHHMNLSNTTLRQQPKEYNGKDTPQPPQAEPTYENLVWGGLMEFFGNNESKAGLVIQAQAVFSDVTNIKHPYLNGHARDYRNAEAQWWGPLDRMLSDCNQDLDIFRDGVAQVLAIADAPDGFTISCPRSAVKTFGSVLAKKSRGVTVETSPRQETVAERIARLFPDEVNS